MNPVDFMISGIFFYFSSKLNSKQMKIQFFTFTSLLFLLGSCGCENEKELKFDTKVLHFIEIYNSGKIIYFSNQSGLLDTIQIKEKNEWTNNCMYHGMALKIQHLPNNRWNNGHEINERGIKTINQSLIEIGKELYDSKYYIGIKYRNFYGEITDSTEIRKDTLFNYCKQSKYLIINDKNSNYKDYIKDSLHVMKVFWTNKFGLSGYQLRNGDIYRIMK
jgi:hypothetical protein